MDTPIIKLSEKDLETVYEPSEDSFLLIDALEIDLPMLKALEPKMCLEVGSGSGVVITALAVALKKFNETYFLAIDINPYACKATKRTSLINSVNIDVVQMDLLSCIRSSQVFDIVIFNPPYVVTETNEILNNGLLSKTWAGGHHGRQVMEQIFASIPNILSDKGIFYLVIIKENDPEYILHTFKKLNIVGMIVAERKVRGEHLYVLRFTKKGQKIS